MGIGYAFMDSEQHARWHQKMDADDIRAKEAIHTEGQPFTELNGLAIERDELFPIHVTVIFCKATSDDVISKADGKNVREQLLAAQKHADYVGSLAVNPGAEIPTEFKKAPNSDKEEALFALPSWWRVFWERYAGTFPDLTEESAIRALRHELGTASCRWHPYPQVRREALRILNRCRDGWVSLDEV